MHYPALNKVCLFEELRLIERGESEINGAWKGVHLLLFFLAFVFGSFCTFCFHMLMYLFDEKCVLFPKLLSLTSLRHNVIYEFIPEEKEKAESLPVDFLGTQWVEKSACYLPTYVPLVSGIFGLVWTSMFLMCSTGSRTLTGLQRPWRVIPPVFVFSLAMGSLCIYSSSVTHYGLRDLCIKLGEISGSSTCSYTVNVATLAYERRIRGVYQATQLTIASAWLHTSCWLASALLALVRILMAVDFRLVNVRVELIGDIDKMLERNEQQLQSVFPNQWLEDERRSVDSGNQIYFKSEESNNDQISSVASDILFISKPQEVISELSLLPEERNRLARIEAYQKVRKEYQFIVNLLYDLLESINYTMTDFYALDSSTSGSLEDLSLTPIARQFGQQMILSKGEKPSDYYESKHKAIESEENKRYVYEEIRRNLVHILDNLPTETMDIVDRDASSTSNKKERIAFESTAAITPEMNQHLIEEQLLHSPTKSDSRLNLKNNNEENEPHVESSSVNVQKKSNLKSDVKEVGVQTDKKQKTPKAKQKVTIADAKSSPESSSSNEANKDGNTQTDPKEKID